MHVHSKLLVIATVRSQSRFSLLGIHPPCKIKHDAVWYVYCCEQLYVLLLPQRYTC